MSPTIRVQKNDRETEEYTLVVGIVRTKDADGKVRSVEFLFDHESVNLSDPHDREFITCFVPSRMLEADPPAGTA